MEEKVPSTLVYYLDGVRTSDVSRRELFVYPDYRDGWFSVTYHGDYFFNYLRRNKLMNRLYRSANDLNGLHLWVAKAYEWKPPISDNSYAHKQELPDAALETIVEFISQHPEGRTFDINLHYLILANHAFERGDSTAGLNYYHKIDQARLPGSLNRYEYLEKTFLVNMWDRLACQLASIGMTEEATTLVEKMPQDAYRAFSYAHLANKVYTANTDPRTFVFLDSCFAKTENLDFQTLPPALNSTFEQIMVLSEIGSSRLNAKADELLRDIPEGPKIQGIKARVNGIASEGNYFRARMAIPNTLTETQDLICRTMILLEAAREKEAKTGNTSWKPMDEFINRPYTYVYYFPN